MVIVLRGISQYLKKHLIARFVLILSLIVFLLAVLFLNYLRYAYLNYLEETSLQTENAVLAPLKKNIDNSIENVVNFGSELAVSQQLYQATVNVEESAGHNSLALYNYLISCEYPSEEVSTAIIGEDGMLGQYDRYKTSSGGVMWNSRNMETIESIYKEVIAKCKNYDNVNPYPRYVLETEPSIHASNGNMYVFHIAYPVLGGHSGLSNVKYVLVVTYKMELFKDFLDTVEIPKVNYLQGYIADSEGRILYHRKKSYIGKAVEILTDTGEVKICSEQLNFFGWTLNIRIEENELKEHVNQIYSRGYYLYILILLTYIVIVSYMMKRILRPVQKISNAIQTVKDGNFHEKINIEGAHEIWQLAQEYNRMVDQLSEKEKEVEKQHQLAMIFLERQYQAEWEALESQINAHFICNTLGIINYEAIENGNDKVSVMIRKLSNILRYTFDQKRQEVFFRQEVAWIEQYLYLQKARFEDLFNYEISYDEIYGDWPCCKLMLQPFVENSIIHGLAGKHSGGHIRISAMEKDGRLQVSISDNGKGMEPSVEEKIQEILRTKGTISQKEKSRAGVGILNVVTRMRMFYGENLSISLITEADKGTEFIFQLPIPETESGM